MPYVIAEPCIGTKDASCTEVCPVDCIKPLRDDPDFASTGQLFIDPEECIECDACVPACPVRATSSAERLPERWAHYVERNREFFEHRDV